MANTVQDSIRETARALHRGIERHIDHLPLDLYGQAKRLDDRLEQVIILTPAEANQLLEAVTEGEALGATLVGERRYNAAWRHGKLADMARARVMLNEKGVL